MAAASEQPRRHSWTVPGTLRIGIIGDPLSLNPLLATTVFDFELAQLCFDGLVAVDDGGHITPDLAINVPTRRNGGISADGKTLVYHLRHNVAWHDGARFTSADVAFTWRAILSSRNNVSVRTGYDQVERVETPDNYTVVFHLKRPFAPAAAELMGQAVVLPAHLLQRFDDINHVDFNQSPIGTGPFRFVRWQRDDSIEYVANGNYHFGSPRLKKIIVKIVPSASTMLTELRTHAVDWYAFADAKMFFQARRDPDLRTASVRQNAVTLLVLNVTHSTLADVRVRRAIAEAIDRRVLAVRSGLQGIVPACGDIQPDSWAFDPELQCPFDSAAAERELKDKKLTLSLAYIAASEFESTALQLQQMLAHAGVDIRLHGYAPPVFLAPGTGGILSGGHYDMALVSIDLGADPDDSLVLSCGNRAPSGINYSRYCSREMDALQAASLATFDKGKRKRIIGRLENLMVRDTPEVCLWFNPNLNIMSTDVKGVVNEWGYMSAQPYEWSI